MNRFGRFVHGPDGWSRLEAAVSQLVAAARHHEPRSASTSIDPDELAARVRSLDPCPEVGVGMDSLAAELSDLIVAHSVDVTSPYTIAHLHCPTLVESAAAEALIGGLNQSMDTYDQSPAATFLEDHAVRWLGEQFGLSENRSGVFTAGGTASNILAMTLARERISRRGGRACMDQGLAGGSAAWCVIASDQAHFSVAQATAMLGLGRQAVCTVSTDDRGAMRVDALDETLARCVAAGRQVMAIVATAGTTDAGAIDPVRAIGERARQLGAWFHVDAAVGSAFVLSDRLRELLDGTELADSVTTDFHKLWWQPIGASALLVAEGAVFDSIREESHYLDRDVDVEAGVLNLVGRSLDTTRRADVVKLVSGLRATGRRAMGAMLEHLVALASETASLVDAHPDLELCRPANTVMVLFRVRADGRDEEGLDQLNTDVQRTMFDSGRAVLGRTLLDGRVVLKLTFVNPLADLAAVEVLLAEIVAAAQSID